MNARLSVRAQRDLIGIRNFIFQDNPARSVSFAEEIVARILTLVDHPYLGTKVPNTSARVRVLVHERYLIYYRVDANEILVSRILHSARSIQTH